MLRRHVASFFGLTEAERSGLLALVSEGQVNHPGFCGGVAHRHKTRCQTRQPGTSFCPFPPGTTAHFPAAVSAFTLCPATNPGGGRSTTASLSLSPSVTMRCWPSLSPTVTVRGWA